MSELEDLLKAAKDLEKSGKYDEAENYIDYLVNKIEDKKVLSELFNLRGIVKRMLGKYDEALTDYSLAINSDLENKEQCSAAYTNIADIQRIRHTRHIEEAHASLDEALAYAEHNNLMHAKAVDQRGLVYFAQNNYKAAIKSHEKAKEICEHLLEKDPDNEDVKNRFGQAVHHLGVDYVYSNDSKNADQAYKSQITALDIFKKLEDQQGIVNCVSTLGEISQVKHNPDQALSQYTVAWNILKQTNYKRAITPVALGIAESYLMQSETEKAIPFLETFAKGVNKEHITMEHDIPLLQKQFNRVRSLYNHHNLNVDEFEKAKNYFKSEKHLK